MNMTTRTVAERASSFASSLAAMLVLLALSGVAHAGGGPLGIDSRVGPGQDTGVWSRRNQLLLQDVAVLSVLTSALWEGDNSRFGHTSWQAADAMLIGSVAAQGLKVVFSRSRPSQTDNPNEWFRGSGRRSFPSGEVMLVTTAVTPYVLEYAREYPAVWALELLPVYDAIARVKSRGHWQTDVLASFAIGTGIAYYAHERKTSLSVGVLPGGFTIGWKTKF